MKITRRVFLGTGTAMATVAIAELGKSNRGFAITTLTKLFTTALPKKLV